MAKAFLSQDEVDALLNGVTGVADEAPAPEDTAGVRPYNLATQERIVRGRMPTLEIINERFARMLRIGLFNFVRRTAEISVGPVRVVKYSEFVRNLVVPTNLNLVQIKPLRGTGLLIFNPDLVYLIIDNLFGGNGQFHTRVEGRDFTQTVGDRTVGAQRREYASVGRVQFGCAGCDQSTRSGWRASSPRTSAAGAGVPPWLPPRSSRLAARVADRQGTGVLAGHALGRLPHRGVLLEVLRRIGHHISCGGSHTLTLPGGARRQPPMSPWRLPDARAARADSRGGHPGSARANATASDRRIPWPRRRASSSWRGWPTTGACGGSTATRATASTA